MQNNNNSPVALVKFDGTLDALRSAIALSDGFKELKNSDKVLLKPNLVWGGSRKMPPFGIVTTSRIVADLLQLLSDYDCDISIGEGTVVNDELGSNTAQAFRYSGIERVAKKYGAKLVDFNKEASDQVVIEGAKVNIARSALESDFLINVPVLKTHSQEKISLGMKNLKGCLRMRSKMKFHQKGLSRMIALLSTVLRTKLTIIDGIYALERGPSRLGKTYRTNLIIAGRDSLSCDMVGASLLGIDPPSVDHLKEFSAISGRPLDINEVTLKGEKLEAVTTPLEWDIDYENFFREAGISGITIQKPGKTVCTNCASNSEALIHAFCKDNKGMNLAGVEICVGSEIKPKAESRKTFLVGNCAISSNRDVSNAFRVKGCPIELSDFMMTLVSNIFDKRKAVKVLSVRALKSIGRKIGVYDEHFPTYGNYQFPEFDRAHF